MLDKMGLRCFVLDLIYKVILLNNFIFNVNKSMFSTTVSQ